MTLHLNKNNRKMHREYLKKTSLSRLAPSNYLYWSEQLRATPARTDILDLLKKSAYPLSTVEIHEKLSEMSPTKIIHPATIYRTLNTLVKMGLIWKIYTRTRKRALFEIKPFK